MTEETQSFEASGDRSPHRSGDLIDGRYDLEQPLSGGVMATVWRAHDRVLGRDVAVKLWSDGSPEALRSRNDELSAARLIDPNLNELLDAGLHRGQPYLVSELRESDQGPQPELLYRPRPVIAATPPAGQPATRPPGRDRTMGIVVASLILTVALVVFGVLVQPGTDQDSGATSDTVAVAASSVASFDPHGDGDENPETVRAVLDGDPATAWTTDRYNTRLFGNLKPGVGLILSLPQQRSLASLEIDTAEGGWSAQIHGAASAATTLDEWGAPITRIAEAGVSVAFDLQGRTVGAVLIWFTDLGDKANRLTVSEIRLTANS